MDRAVLLASVELAIEAAEQAEASANQVSLFGDEETVLNAVEYVRVPNWTEKYKLTEEKGVLGFCLSGHLFHAYARKRAVLPGPVFPNSTYRGTQVDCRHRRPVPDANVPAGQVMVVSLMMAQRLLK